MLFINEPCDKHKLSTARITYLLMRKNGDINRANIEYRGEVGGHAISANHNLRHLYFFMNAEKTVTQKRILGLEENGEAGTTAPVPDTQSLDLQDEVSSHHFHQYRK